MSADLKELQLLLINNGTNRVFVNEGGLCRVPTIKTGVNLITTDGSLYRYPNGNEVAAMYVVYFYSDNKHSGTFIDSGKTLISSTPRASVYREMDLQNFSNETIVRGYCSVSFIGPDGESDGSFVDLNVIDFTQLSNELALLPRNELANNKHGPNPSAPFPAAEEDTSK